MLKTTNVNNRNVSGRIALPDGSGHLVFDIRGNGSNVRDFRIINCVNCEDAGCIICQPEHYCEECKELLDYCICPVYAERINFGPDNFRLTELQALLNRVNVEVTLLTNGFGVHGALVIPEGSTLIIPAGVRFDVAGVNGILTVDGTLVNNALRGGGNININN